MCIFKFLDICYLGFSVGLTYKILISNLKSNIISLETQYNQYLCKWSSYGSYIALSINHRLNLHPTLNILILIDFFSFYRDRIYFYLSICYINECYCFDASVLPPPFLCTLTQLH